MENQLNPTVESTEDVSVEKEVEDPRDGVKGKVDDQKDQSNKSTFKCEY